MAASLPSSVGTSANYSQFLNEPSFPFLIGLEKKKFYVHPGVLKPISEKLYKQTQPGWKEHDEGVVLAQFEPQTFTTFAEYAYTGDYSVHGNTLEQAYGSDYDKPYHGLTAYNCRRCRTRCTATEQLNLSFPFCNHTCRNQAGQNSYPQNMYCVLCTSAMGSRYGDTGVITLCQTCIITQENKKSPTGGTITTKPAGRAFCDLRIDVGTYSHNEMTKRLDVLAKEGKYIACLVLHAKLYVFADYNIIPDLKALCLLKLHRDLLAFHLSSETVSLVVDLLKFTYENTDHDVEEANPGGSIRTLVMMHAVGLAKELMDLEEFRAMLVAGGDLVKDFLAGVSKQLP